MIELLIISIKTNDGLGTVLLNNDEQKMVLAFIQSIQGGTIKASKLPPEYFVTEVESVTTRGNK